MRNHIFLYGKMRTRTIEYHLETCSTVDLDLRASTNGCYDETPTDGRHDEVPTDIEILWFSISLCG